MTETFVLDCSVAAKWVLPEPDREAALSLFERYAAGEISLIAPDLLLAEFASLLARHSRRKQISPEQARDAFHLMTMCAPRLCDTRPLFQRALELALRHHMSLWDCVYVALGVEFACPVLTADRRLFRATGGRHPSLRLVG